MFRILTAIITLFLVAGCTQPSRSQSVTIYSVPPVETKEYSSDQLRYFDPEDGQYVLYEVYGDWDSEEGGESLRVARQTQLAQEFAYDRDAVPYGIGVVRDERVIDLPRGLSEYRFADIAKHIEPDTVHFKCVSRRASVRVLEQSFEYDLISGEALLDKYVNRHLTVVGSYGGHRVSGVLLSADDSYVVLKTESGELEVLSDSDIERFILPKMPGGLISRPTLAWLLESKRAGPHRLRVSYRTRGLMWEANYTAILSPDETKLDLSGTATIGNASGAVYRNAKLKLVAGEVNLVEPMEPIEDSSGDAGGFCLEDAGKEEIGFKEKSFFEYHLYTLGRPCTIRNYEVKQIELFRPVSRVGVKKTYVYHGTRTSIREDLRTASNTKVDIYLQFVNEKKAGLGMPLPAGRVRILKRDPTDGEVELVGEDIIGHTPRDEEVILRLGSAFDISGKRTQVGFKLNSAERWLEETIEIVLSNHKDEEVEVTAKETMCGWATWEIMDSSCRYVREGPPLPVKEEEEEKELEKWRRILLEKTRGQKVNLRFTEEPLSQVVPFLAKEFGVPIRLVRKDESVDPPVTLRLLDATLDKALGWLIVLIGDYHLSTEGESVIITDKQIPMQLEEYTYDLSGLYDRNIYPDFVYSLIRNTLGSDFYDDEDTLMEMEDGKLVVVNTPATHKKIVTLLGNLMSSPESRTILFHVSVPPESEKKISYTVRYRW